jgi:transcriptional regulator with XRE-family HTH domain
MEKVTQKLNSELFKERLVFAMQERGVNNSQIASAVGLTRSIVSEYVNGNKVPRFQNVVKIANFLGVNRFWLLGDLSAESGFRSQIDIEEKNYYQNKRDLIALMIYEYSRSKKSYLVKYDELILIVSLLNEEGLDRMISLGNDLSTIDKYNLGRNEGDILTNDELKEEFFRYQKINFLLGDINQMRNNQDEAHYLLIPNYNGSVLDRK